MDRNEYDVVELFGITALFINGRFSRENVPEGLYCYDLRGSDYDPGDPATVEHHVLVNHAGTILTAKPIEIPAQGYLPLGEGLNFITDVMTINEFRKKYVSPEEVMSHQEQNRASDHPSQSIKPSIRSQLAEAKAEQAAKPAAHQHQQDKEAR